MIWWNVLHFSMIDSKLLEVYVNELKTKPETRRQYLPAFHDLLQMHISILHLIQSCVVHDVNVQGILLKDKQALRQLVLLLGVAFTGKIICSSLQCFHKIKMDFIRTGHVHCHFGKSEDTLFRSENKLQDNMVIVKSEKCSVFVKFPHTTRHWEW